MAGYTQQQQQDDQVELEQLTRNLMRCLADHIPRLDLRVEAYRLAGRHAYYLRLQAVNEQEQAIRPKGALARAVRRQTELLHQSRGSIWQ